MKYSRIISAVMATPWAIRPEKLSSILSFLRFKSDDGEMSKEEIALVKQPAKEPAYFAISETHDGVDVAAAALEIAAGSPSNAQRSKAGQIAVLPISGTISHRIGMMSEMSGGTSTERVTQWLRAAVNDPSVKAIVLDVNSPGGTVDGVPELADEIYKANQIKPVTAVANSQAASAAYWLAAQAKELVVTPSGAVGSIGVFGAHEDMSEALASAGVKISLVSAGKYKTEGNPFEPLSEEARAALQADVNNYYEMFTKAVARGRNSDQATVKAGFGEGRMVSAAKAVKAGMADRVATLDQTLARLGARTAMPNSVKADAELNALDTREKVEAEQEKIRAAIEVGNIVGEFFSADVISPVSPCDGYAYSEDEFVCVTDANTKAYRRSQPGRKQVPASSALSTLDLLERELELESL